MPQFALAKSQRWRAVYFGFLSCPEGGIYLGGSVHSDSLGRVLKLRLLGNIAETV